MFLSSWCVALTSLTLSHARPLFSPRFRGGGGRRRVVAQSVSTARAARPSWQAAAAAAACCPRRAGLAFVVSRARGPPTTPPGQTFWHTHAHTHTHTHIQQSEGARGGRSTARLRRAPATAHQPHKSIGRPPAAADTQPEPDRHARRRTDGRVVVKPTPIDTPTLNRVADTNPRRSQTVSQSDRTMCPVGLQSWAPQLGLVGGS
jgi:hypothetical protein